MSKALCFGCGAEVRGGKLGQAVNTCPKCMGTQKIKALRGQASRQKALREVSIDPDLLAWALDQLEYAIRCGHHHRPSEVVQAMGEWVDNQGFDRPTLKPEFETQHQNVPPTLEHCVAGRDGECNHGLCPQNRDGEPGKTGRHCPLPYWGDHRE